MKRRVGKGPMTTRVLGPVGGPQLTAKAFPTLPALPGRFSATCPN
jgi:hypothetical protein